MHILVTNDDGVTAPGLLGLAQAMRSLGKVSILSPDSNWSGGGHVKTLDRPLRIKEVTLADGSAALASDGAPSDCVALALLGFLPEKVDLVISGINPFGRPGPTRRPARARLFLDRGGRTHRHSGKRHGFWGNDESDDLAALSTPQEMAYNNRTNSRRQ
jgi:hypothetical protein